MFKLILVNGENIKLIFNSHSIVNSMGFFLKFLNQNVFELLIKNR